MQISKSQVTNENRHIGTEAGYINAYYVVAWFLHYGLATLEAACAIAGNALHEIHCNPGGSEGHVEPPDPDRGYGILQWTPCSTKIFAYAQQVGKPVNDMDTQLEFIIWQANNGHGYYPQPQTPTPVSYLSFLASHDNVDYLARAFAWNAEGRNQTQTSLDARAAEATYMYNWCTNDPPELVIEEPKRGLPLFMQYIAVTGGY
jgi:hypothetical protein